VCVPFGTSLYTVGSGLSELERGVRKQLAWRSRQLNSHGRDPIRVFREGRKTFLIKALGGGCLSCGYSRCNRNLAFHHIYDKQFNISGREFQFSLRKLKPELLKCVLVCHNCHGEIHDGIIDDEKVRKMHLTSTALLSEVKKLPTYGELVETISSNPIHPTTHSPVIKNAD